MSKYGRLTGAEKFALLLALILGLAFNLFFALLCVGLPMILFSAPTWAWVGATLVAVYASIDGSDS